MKNIVYLDHSATTPVDSRVMETFVKVSTDFWGNPSSLHKVGLLAEQVLVKSERQILDLLNARNHRVVLTSGATESNNLAIKGVMLSHPSGHLITTKIEHPSVHEVCLDLARKGWRVSYLDVDQPATKIVEQLEALIEKDTRLVSCMHVNSEMGLVLPIKEMGEVIAKHPRVKFHVDGVQSVGKLPLDVSTMNIDLLSISGHKIHGIKGVGALIVGRNLNLQPEIIGGGQMDGLRSGTVHVAGAASLAKAVRLVMEPQKENHLRIGRLFDYIVKKLNQMERIQINSCFEKQSPYIVNLHVAGIKGETLVHALESHHVYVSAKSACSSKTSKASAILLALGFDEKVATESVRVSFSHGTTLAEVDHLLEALEILVREMNEK